MLYWYQYGCRIEGWKGVREMRGRETKTNTLSSVKRANKQLLYQMIKENYQMTMTELERMTELSRPTVSGLIRELEEENLVKKNGYGVSSGGRNPSLYSINAEAAFVLGIDFEFPYVRMAISDLECSLVSSSIEVYDLDMDMKQAIEALFEQIDRLIQNSGVKKEKILSAGVGMPGTINYKESFSVIIERMRDWENVPIGQILENHLRIPVYIDNDVNLISWAERRLCMEHAPDNMLYFIIRTGIGMAIWADGRLLEGERGNSGRIGHMTVDMNGPRCRCGSRGCLGLYINRNAMKEMYFEKTGKNFEKRSELVQLAADGDQAAKAVLERAGYVIGIGIVNAVNLFDISECVIQASFDLTELMGYARESLINRGKNTLKGDVHLRMGGLKEEQYALGGCLLALDHVGLDDFKRVSQR